MNGGETDVRCAWSRRAVVGTSTVPTSTARALHSLPSKAIESSTPWIRSLNSAKHGHYQTCSPAASAEPTPAVVRNPRIVAFPHPHAGSVPMCDIAVIGAGPYGLSAGAYLRQIKGMEVRVLGEPMEFWRSRMPLGMLLRSAWSASSIADPGGRLSLDAYKRASGNHLCSPIHGQRFIEYGLWFQHSAVPDVDRRKVTHVARAPAGFRLTLEDGCTFSASRVLVAAGLAAFAKRPAQFQGLPPDLATHTSEAQDLARFSGKRVAVIGAGQSALESAALLHEAGAQVEVIMRARRVHWLGWKERFQRVGPLSRALFSKD